MKHCVLDENKLCTDCGDCNRCDLDLNKICDNCCKCLETDKLFSSVPVADIVTEQTSSYLHEYYSNDENEENELDITYDIPDAKLLAEWEERLRAYEEQQKQHIPNIRGVRKRKDED